MSRNKPPDDPASPPQRQLFLGDAFAPASPAPPPERSVTTAARAPVGRTVRIATPSPAPVELVGPSAEVDLDGVEPTDLPPPPREPKVFTVMELVRSARVMLETRYADVRVEGEISGMKPSPTGHLYFTLKEAQAQVDCVMFSRDAARLKFKPRDGMQVRCRGRLTIYEGRGKFQMTLVDIEPAGAGALALAFLQLKQRLEAEGLFAPERKRPLPFLPRCVGVVTSPTGAVIRDIVHVAHRRFPMRIVLSPTPVQGESAAGFIVNALERLWRVPGIDVIILARGGGSLEDLWAFNEERVARAIARSPVPVISAVGHETDFTIADFVADRRAPTPSAAAEIAIPEMRALREELVSASRRLHRCTDRELHRARLALERLTTRLSDPRRLLDRRRQSLDDLQTRAENSLKATLGRKRVQLRTVETALLRAHPQKRIAVQRAHVVALEQRLAKAAVAAIAPRKQALGRLTAKLEALSPLRVLDRGYSLVRTADGRLVTSKSDVSAGQRIDVTLKQGTLVAVVEQTSQASDDKRKDDE
ncbi:MAG: exodeoxyribonuclease VII large subunit [Deltaproteobacteria bacterium]|nr:exodeoxyribonuclease VII large subunit [Deltaproteobacteria bacterium]